MIRPGSFLRDHRGAAAAEFAMVVPVALLFLLGTIDIGRYFWKLNQVEKAVQAGTRYAVATDIVATGLNAETYANFDCGDGGLTAGSTICKDALGTITCTKASANVSCTCAESALGTGSCPADLSGPNVAAFDAIVRRMRVIDAGIAPSQVRIKYSGSGVGFAGDPATDDDGDDLAEIAPIVTVEVAGHTFRSMSLLGYGMRVPRVRYSQTLEDGDGAIAY